MPRIANIALIILEYQLIMVQPQVVFCWESMSILAAPAHPRTSVRIWINPMIIKVFMLELFIMTIKLGDIVDKLELSWKMLILFL